MERTCKKVKSCVIPGRHTLAKLCIRIPLNTLGHFNTINKTDFSDNYMSYTSNVGKLIKDEEDNITIKRKAAKIFGNSNIE